MAYNMPIIRAVESVRNLSQPMHHGFKFSLNYNNEPNLQYYKLFVAGPDGIRHLFADKVEPHNLSTWYFPYRGTNYALKAETNYQITLCAIYENGNSEEYCSPSVPLAAFANFDAENSPDTDDDGLILSQEYNAGMDPRNPDSDNDDMGDRVELILGGDPNLAQFPSLESDSEINFNDGDSFGFYADQHRPVIINNTGDRMLRVFNILIDGDDHAFKGLAESRMINRVDLSNMKSIPIDFLPTAPGNYTATLTLLSDDRENFPAQITLQGIGKEIANLGVKLPDDAHEIQLGEIELGEIMDSPEILLTNTDSDMPLHVRVFMEPPMGFMMALNEYTIQPDEELPIQFKFLPQWQGSYEANLVIQGLNDRQKKQIRIPVYGTGLGADLPKLNVNRNIRLDATPVGTCSYYNLGLHNDGIAQLFIKYIDFGNLQGSPDITEGVFSISSRRMVIAPGAMKIAQLKFCPKEADKEYSTHMCIVSNDTRAVRLNGCAEHRSIGNGAILPQKAKRVKFIGRGL